MLNWKPVALLGQLTYSLYLVHQIVLYTLRDRAPELGMVPRAILALGISLALAEAIAICVERPAARWRRRLRAGSKPDPGAVQPDPLVGAP